MHFFYIGDNHSSFTQRYLQSDLLVLLAEVIKVVRGCFAESALDIIFWYPRVQAANRGRTVKQKLRYVRKSGTALPGAFLGLSGFQTWQLVLYFKEM